MSPLATLQLPPRPVVMAWLYELASQLTRGGRDPEDGGLTTLTLFILRLTSAVGQSCWEGGLHTPDPCEGKGGPSP